MTTQCPECASHRIWKDGFRYVKTEIGESSIQRYLCRNCGKRFSGTEQDSVIELKVEEDIVSQSIKELDSRSDFAQVPVSQSDFSSKKALNNPSFSVGEDVSSHVGSCKSTAEKDISAFASTLVNAQVCATEDVAKNLVKVETRTEERAAGATPPHVKGKLVEFLFWMQKEGYAESTIASRGSRLRRLLKLKADLFNPESVKAIITTQKSWSIARKAAMVWAYDLWARWLGIEWEKPRYKAPRKLPFIPLEREIDDIIASCSKYVAAFLQLAKETGGRAGEIYNLKWIDTDSENRTVNITPEKGSNPRILKMSNRLVAMLNTLPKEHEQIFKHYQKLNYLRRSFERYRKRTAHKLGNPRILKITFHTLRHWKATMEYHRTKDILYVMSLLGHRNIKNTLLYTQLVKFKERDDFICKVAKTPKEVKKLIENGFQYVCEQEDLKFFRKRK